MSSQGKKNFKWIIKKFEDEPHYCRMPIYLGGERQIHIMQPFFESDPDRFVNPKNAS